MESVFLLSFFLDLTYKRNFRLWPCKSLLGVESATPSMGRLPEPTHLYYFILSSRNSQPHITFRPFSFNFLFYELSIVIYILYNLLLFS